MSTWHKGWVLFAPVYVDMTNEYEPLVVSRLPILDPLLDAALWCQGAMIGFLSMCTDEYVPMFSIKLTGNMAKPPNVTAE